MRVGKSIGGDTANSILGSAPCRGSPLFGLQVRLVVLVSAFVLVSTYWPSGADSMGHGGHVLPHFYKGLGTEEKQETRN